MLISPTEPYTLKQMGKLSLVPEEYGADILWLAHGKRWGVQRKTPADLVASLQDGRLNKEVLQMKSLDFPVLIIDGEWQWTGSGNWVGAFKQFTKSQYVSLLASLQSEGLWIFYAKNTDDLKTTVLQLQQWSLKMDHSALKGRREPVQSWGKAGTKDYQIHVLTSLPGVGVGLAEKILDTLGMIVTSTVSLEQLMTVPGIGKGRATKILATLTSKEDSSLSSVESLTG